MRRGMAAVHFHNPIATTHMQACMHLLECLHAYTDTDTGTYTATSMQHINTYFTLSKGSRPTVGSSNINRAGSWSSATANDTRRCWPPLNNNSKHKQVNTTSVSSEWRVLKHNTTINCNKTCTPILILWYLAQPLL